MAAFLSGGQERVTRGLALRFASVALSPGAKEFSIEEIQLLLAKVREFRLAVGRER